MSTPQTYQDVRVHPPAIAGTPSFPTVTLSVSCSDTTRESRVKAITTDEPLAEARRAIAANSSVSRYRGLRPQIVAAEVAVRKTEAAVTLAKARLELVEAEAGSTASYIADRDAASAAIAAAEAVTEKARADAAHIARHGPSTWDVAKIGIDMAVRAAKSARRPALEEKVEDLRKRLADRLTELAPLIGELVEATAARDRVCDDLPKPVLDALIDGTIGPRPFVYTPTPMIIQNPISHRVGV